VHATPPIGWTARIGRGLWSIAPRPYSYWKGVPEVRVPSEPDMSLGMAQAT